jgi:hypothetical protein
MELESILQTKQNLLGKKIQLLKEQLQTRYDIWKTNKHEIYQNILRCDNEIISIEQAYNAVPSASQTIIQNEISNLERDKRQEYTKWWNDNQTINKQLFDTIIEYEKEKNNQCLFNTITNENIQEKTYDIYPRYLIHA